MIELSVVGRLNFSRLIKVFCRCSQWVSDTFIKHLLFFFFFHYFYVYIIFKLAVIFNNKCIITFTGFELVSGHIIFL